MEMTRRWLVGAALLLAPNAALAQWENGDLALRTNGDLFQKGDRLKVELLALGPILGPFAAEVRYLFDEDATELDDEGRRRKRRRPTAVSRPLGAPVDRMDPYQRLVVDDTFTLPEGPPGECLRIEVRVFPSNEARRPLTTLASCVCRDRSNEVPPECAPYVRGLKEGLGEDALVFDGVFSTGGDYSVVLILDDNVEAHVPRGTANVSAGNLQVFSGLLTAGAGRALDVLVHDHRSERSSTVKRLPLPTRFR
jgi:hypothetical protein